MKTVDSNNTVNKISTCGDTAYAPGVYMSYGYPCGDGLASTTGNIYGVYDMSGGALEAVMAVFDSTLANSGFTKLPVARYYDNYTGYVVSKRGDAVYETSGSSTAIDNNHDTRSWFGASSIFIHSVSPWMLRGGEHGGRTSNIFSFVASNGSSNLGFTFRLVLIP